MKLLLKMTQPYEASYRSRKTRTTGTVPYDASCDASYDSTQNKLWDESMQGEQRRERVIKPRQVYTVRGGMRRRGLKEEKEDTKVK